MGTPTRSVLSVDVVKREPSECQSPVICSRCPTSKYCGRERPLVRPTVGVLPAGTPAEPPNPYPSGLEAAAAAAEQVHAALVVPGPELRAPVGHGQQVIVQLRGTWP